MLFSCDPNPAGAMTSLSYTIPAEGKVILDLHNILGNKVAVLINETQPAGHHKLNFETISLPEGIYLAALRLISSGGETVRTIKIVIKR
jgi:hypothetical protein